jgi:6-pyruvoyltetrahydropterin/6-carboxytetrahydropterin synthase
VYQIAIEQHFDAAHFLRGYRGKCEAMHGHRFGVVVRVEAAGLNDIGLAYDFADLKQHLAEVLARFDHTCLNEVPPFDKITPSSEHIAATIYAELKPKLSGALVTLSSVEVWESPQSGVIYTPD